MMKTFPVLLVMIICARAGFGQPSPNTLWTRTYGGGSADMAYSVQQTADGGYIIAGWTSSFGAGGQDLYLVKTNSQGDTLWTRTYGGSDGDLARSVQQTDDGGYIVAGQTPPFGTSIPDFYLLKTNGQGDTLWTRTYGGSSVDGAWSVQQTADGGYIVAGRSRSFSVGNYDFYLVKTSSQGDIVWTHTYGGSNDDEAFSVQQTADGGYVMAGYTKSFGAGTPNYTNFWLVKTNSLGDTLWTRTYGGYENDEAYSVLQTADGGYIVAGYTRSFGAGDYDFYIIKTNNQGDTLWTHTYGGSFEDYARSVQQTADGGYIVAGRSDSYGVNLYLVRMNSQGDSLWARTYGGSNADEALSVQQTANGGYIVAGRTNSFGAGNYDFYLVKTGPEDSWGLVITTSGGNVILDWLPTGAASYEIYGATFPFVEGVLLDVTSNTIWTDINTANRPSPYFYYVTAASPQ